jgi:Mn2+/Fe2+ NRAMP family transporter
MTEKQSLPLKKQIIPAIMGAIATLIMWTAGGALIRMLPISDTLKGLGIVVSAVIVFILVNNFFAKRALKEK